jgi:hypothetical protein
MTPPGWGKTMSEYSDIVSDGKMDPRWSRQTNLKDIPHPAKPEWQGLTLEDIDDIGVSKDWVCGARWAEAKLKEKNT